MSKLLEIGRSFVDKNTVSTFAGTPTSPILGFLHRVYLGVYWLVFNPLPRVSPPSFV